MRLLLTGANGQFGRMFQETATGHQVVPLGHADLAVEDAAAVRRAVERVRPDWIVHAAAMTDVDGCEADPARAHAVNATGTENMARAAAAAGCRLLAISTDYVFDGRKPGGRYREEEPPNPLSVYGASKLDGERRALAALPSATIARAAVVWGPHKPNFVTWVRDSLKAGKPLRIVRDQWVSPTHTRDLSRQALALVEAGAEGVFHAAGRDRLSRLDMAKAIAAAHGLDPSRIEAIGMDDLAWKARRPRDSSLDVGKVSRLADPQGFATTLAWEVPA